MNELVSIGFKPTDEVCGETSGMESMEDREELLAELVASRRRDFVGAEATPNKKTIGFGGHRA